MSEHEHEPEPDEAEELRELSDDELDDAVGGHSAAPPIDVGP